MIKDFLFVARVLIYSAVIALIMQVQWKGESLEQKAMRWVAESSVGSSLTDLAQQMAWKLSNRVDETSQNVSAPPAVAAPAAAKTRTLIELKRSSSQQQHQELN
jgi:hypothetical protein